MSAENITHAAFADESHWNVGRFRGLGLVTLQRTDLIALTEELKDLLIDSNLEEFVWKRLSGAKQRFAALKLTKLATDACCSGRLRIDVLTWDIQDSRHKVIGRDDIANLQRMYYHLFKHVMRERWPDGSIWGLCPHEHTAIDWANVKDFLDLADTQVEARRDIFTSGKLYIRLKQEFKIEELNPFKSQENPLIQLADLFVGLCIFSRMHYSRFESWIKNKDPQSLIFEEEGEHVETSIADRERFKVLSEFDELCKKRKLGVSLKTNKGLKTYNPHNPINFWWYEPQHNSDKAPVRSQE